MDTEGLIKQSVVEFPNSVKNEFEIQFKEELKDFIKTMSIAYNEWKIFDELVKDEDNAHISSLIYGAINMHCTSMHLFISGYPIASGNMFRQVLESVAMAFLCSKKNLGYLKRYKNNKYSTSKAIRDVIKKHKVLNLSHDALQTLRYSREFYDNFSHPTLLSVSMHVSMTNPGELYFGGAYDIAKLPQYKKEINSRVGLAAIFDNFIYGIKRNIHLAGNIAE